jgi:hypothetical protein
MWTRDGVLMGALLAERFIRALGRHLREGS